MGGWVELYPIFFGFLEFFKLCKAPYPGSCLSATGGIFCVLCFLLLVVVVVCYIILYIIREWTELAPVQEGSGSRRRHPRKGKSVDRVCVVFFARVECRIFLLFVNIRGGGAFAEGNSASLSTPVTPEARCHYGFWTKPPSP